MMLGSVAMVCSIGGHHRGIVCGSTENQGAYDHAYNSRFIRFKCLGLFMGDYGSEMTLMMIGGVSPCEFMSTFQFMHSSNT